MTLPLDTPLAKPPADLAPAQALPPALPPPAPDTIAAIVEPALVNALRSNDPIAYFERMARVDPHLFFKWAAMLTGAKRPGAMQQNILNVVTAIPRSPLDELPPGFEINA